LQSMLLGEGEEEMQAKDSVQAVLQQSKRANHYITQKVSVVIGGPVLWLPLLVTKRLYSGKEGCWVPFHRDILRCAFFEFY
jgi:hypothetical protein